MNRYNGTWSVSFISRDKAGTCQHMPGHDKSEAMTGARMLLAGFDAVVIDAVQTPAYRQQIGLAL